jgi:DNA-binding response OmpR family regulator
MLTPSVVVDVEMLRWPGESARRQLCADRDIPCLLLLEAGAPPPSSSRPLEDWIRIPADEVDLVARIRRLSDLADRDGERPVVDEQGIVRVGRRWTVLSLTEAALAHRLTADFGQLVSREDLLATLGPDRRPRNLDLQICRLRRRLTAVDLIISAVRGRGYVLENAPPGAPSGARPS